MDSARFCTGSCGFTTRKKPFDTRLATGTRSFNGSNGMRSYRCGLIASRLSMPTSSVYPSGAAFATASPATTPLPPTRFSTTTGWPSVSLRRAAMRRPTRSGPPPGGIGTRKRTGFDGYCASADAERKTATTNKTLRTRCISGPGNPIEIVLPHVQVALAGLDRCVLHAQLPREFLHRAPAGVRVLDVGLGVQLEELELVPRQPEQLSPAQPLDAEPAVPSEQPAAVARHIDALGAGVGDDALEPVAIRHQPFPGRPGELGRRQRLRVLQLAPLQADAQAEVLEDLPVRPAAAVLVVGDHLLAAGPDDAHAAPGHRLVEPSAARDERVEHPVHARDNTHFLCEEEVHRNAKDHQRARGEKTQRLVRQRMIFLMGFGFGVLVRSDVLVEIPEEVVGDFFRRRVDQARADLRQLAAYVRLYIIGKLGMVILRSQPHLRAALGEARRPALALEGNRVGAGRVDVRERQPALELGAHRADARHHQHLILVVAALLDRLAAGHAGLQHPWVVERVPDRLLRRRDQLLALHFHARFS